MLAFLFKKVVFAFVSFDVLKLTVYNVLYENVNAFRLKIYRWICFLILFLYLYPVFGWPSVLWCLCGTYPDACLWEALYTDVLWDALYTWWFVGRPVFWCFVGRPVCWCLFWEALYTDVLWHALYPDGL